jgi:CHAT domain
VTTPGLLPGLLGSGTDNPAREPAPKAAPRPRQSDDAAAVVVAESEPQGIGTAQLDLRENLPPDTALLKVVARKPGAEDLFELQGHFRGKTWVTTEDELRDQGRLGTILANEIDGEVELAKAVECYRWLQTWSITKHRLSEWLTELRSKAAEEKFVLRLIVWDDTDFGIPWELFWHGDDGWLGVLVPVIRWTTVHDPKRHRQFSAEAGEFGGSDVLYFEDDKLPGAAQASIKPPAGTGYVQKKSMEQLLQALASLSRGYGLVYVRGHGIHSTDLSAATLAGVRLSELDGRPLPSLRLSRPLVFLNACNSARPVIDKRFGDAANRNFAEVFLRKRAAAVVATMAEVPAAQSASLADRLISQARSAGVCLPEALRAHRKKYSRGLPDFTAPLTPEEQNRVRAFLYASSFAYFGHPEAVFKLAAP